MNLESVKLRTSTWIWSYLLILLFIGKESYCEHQGECGLYDWNCKFGQCIPLEDVCDGKKDCHDGSDETVETCLHTYCPSFAFRCAYGACVSGTAECNGEKDCIDNSDELSIQCPDIQNSFRLNGNCSEDYFQCITSHECVLSDNICDGEVNCKDGSDETLQLCSSTFCPSFAFRCGYGACIDGTAKCDGIVDCLDGADESWQICGKDHTTYAPPVISLTTMSTLNPITPTQLIPITPTVTTIIAPPIVLNIPQGSCMIEDIPHLIVTHAASSNLTLIPGQYVPTLTSVNYKCRPKHILEGAHTNDCLNGKWIEDSPKCSKTCSNRIINGVTFKASCEINGIGISCNQPIRVGTHAIISCQVGYKKADITAPGVLRCDEEGEWDYRPFRCEQVCGTEPVKTTPFITGGEVTNITMVPWHVGIYARKNSTYTQICGGTIINSKVVLSAAHCFWNPLEDKLHDHSIFSVGAGKFYRNFYATEDHPAQIFNVSQIHIPDAYNDVHLQYMNDIAVLILNNFIVFNEFIKPICMEFFQYNERSMRSNVLGKIAGWGKLGQSLGSSEVLRSIELLSVGYYECSSKVPAEYKKSVTGDKFCVGDNDGESICSGDSGGGFATSKLLNGDKTYFLSGIASNGLTSKGECGGNIYTTFTNVQYHATMITEFEVKFRPR